MLGDLTRALEELRYRPFWGVALGSVLLTLALLAGLFWLGGWLLGVGGDMTATLPWLGETQAPGVIGVILYVLAALGLSLFLTGPVAALFVGLFMEVVIAAVERRSYAAAGPGTPAPMLDQIKAALLLFLAVLAGNLLVLLLSLLFPPAAPFLLIAVNGWLLGREYVEAVALRRMPSAEAKAFRRRHRGRVLGVGAAMAALMAVPVINLAAPLLGAAAATHLYHRVQAEQ
jgi:uncharacterized protein involved in cysteine biosynthesis